MPIASSALRKHFSRTRKTLKKFSTDKNFSAFYSKRFEFLPLLTVIVYLISILMTGFAVSCLRSS